MSTNEIKLEVCVDSIESALAASEGGAGRLELVSALSEGGLTPTPGILKALKALPLACPIFCMVRPRRGNDFIYSQLELEAMLTDMALLRTYGADGFVFGALTAERNVDVEMCQRVVHQAEGLPVTFHRAFDLTNPDEMHETVERLKEIGFKRLLSSGFRQGAAEGCDQLAQLVAKHHRDIIVMPGAGINVANLDEILTVTKCTEFHSSARASAGGGGAAADGVSGMDCDVATMGKNDVDPYAATDEQVVRKLVAIARATATPK